MKRFGRPHELMQHMRLHVRSTQDSGGNTDPTSPVSHIASPVNLSPLRLPPAKIPSSFHTEVSQSNSNWFDNSAGIVTWQPGQVPGETSERLNRDMQTPRSWETRASNAIENIYPRGDFHSSEMEDVITSNPKKRKSPFGESKDIHLWKSAERFSELFGRMFELQLGQQYIRFPEGLEDDMTGRVVNLAGKAFTIYMGVYGLSKDP
jgi:hypothetical protein